MCAGHTVLLDNLHQAFPLGRHVCVIKNVKEKREIIKKGVIWQCEIGTYPTVSSHTDDRTTYGDDRRLWQVPSGCSTLDYCAKSVSFTRRKR